MRLLAGKDNVLKEAEQDVKWFKEKFHLSPRRRTTIFSLWSQSLIVIRLHCPNLLTAPIMLGPKQKKISNEEWKITIASSSNFWKAKLWM